jgi:hypothetical protein
MWLSGSFTTLSFLLWVCWQQIQDKIFGLLGLAGTEVVPDYSKQPLTSLSNLHIVAFADGNLEFLIWSGLGFLLAPDRRLVGLPSWAPDWQANSDEPITMRSPVHYEESDASSVLEELAPTPNIEDRTSLLEGLIFEGILILEPHGGVMEHELLSRRMKVSCLDNYPLNIISIQTLILVMQGGDDLFGDRPLRLRTDSESFLRVADKLPYQLMVYVCENSLAMAQALGNIRSGRCWRTSSHSWDWRLGKTQTTSLSTYCLETHPKLTRRQLFRSMILNNWPF